MAGDKKNKFDFTQWARDVMDPVFDPLLRLFVWLRITPNMLTIAGTLGHCVAVWFLLQERISAAGISLILLAPLDAMDGALARKLGQPHSQLGAFLDSTLDRVSEVILFFGILAYYFNTQNQMMLLVSFAGISGSLLISYIRAKAEALNLYGKAGFFGRLERYLVIVNLMILGQLDLAMIIVAPLAWLTVAQRFYSVTHQLRELDAPDG